MTPVVRSYIHINSVKRPKQSKKKCRKKVKEQRARLEALDTKSFPVCLVPLKPKSKVDPQFEGLHVPMSATLFAGRL